MCLESTTQRPMVAAEDITCYKLLGKDREGLCTPIYRTPVSLGEAIEARYPNDWPSRGLQHYYMVGGEGVHAYTTFVELRLNCSSWLSAEATIPAGTEYWISSDGKEIAARRMIINRIIN